MVQQTAASLGTVQPRPTGVRLAAGADLAAKAVLLVMVLLVLADPAWGNLEGKAPLERAVTYPMLALALPAWWLVRGRGRPFPWAADLMVTIPGFSDLLGNRLDFFDRVVWFDDWTHFINAALLSAAVLMLTRRGDETRGELFARSVAFGMSVSLAWELWELGAFITRSPEMPTAYVDTLGDLSLGWLGSAVAAIVLGALWRVRPSR